METHKRSIAKALTWRVIAVLITSVTVFLFTKEMVLAVSIGFVDSGIKILAYYSHERAWNRSSFGKIEERDKAYGNGEGI